MKKTVLLDMDGVLVDFLRGAQEVHSHVEFPKDQYLDAKDLSMSKAEFFAPMGREFWVNLKPTKEMRKIIEIVESFVSRENVGILTSPCLTAGCPDGKRDWIRKHLPDGYVLRTVISNTKHYCAKPSTMLIDDQQRHCYDFWNEGGHSLLFPRPWNKSAEYMSCWEKVLENTLREFMES